MNADAQVLIIGSGPAGVAAAWPLLEAGVSVVMVDPSDSSAPLLPEHENIELFRRDPDRAAYELAARDILEESLSPKLATPFAQTILAGFAEAMGLRTEGFFATGSHAAGGLSRIWGGLAMPWDSDDLAHFPDHSDMAASYAKVSGRIGLSRTDESAEFWTEPLRRIFSRHSAIPQGRDFMLEPASNAVLRFARGDRQACNACGLCLYGCSKGAVYHSAWELPQLRKFANFDYRPGLRVRRLVDRGGLHCADAISAEGPVSLTARYIVLAAGTVGSTNLALRRMGMTGQPIRLESNPVGGAGFLVPTDWTKPAGAQFQPRTIILSLDVGKWGAFCRGVIWGRYPAAWPRRRPDTATPRCCHAPCARSGPGACPCQRLSSGAFQPKSYSGGRGRS